MAQRTRLTLERAATLPLPGTAVPVRCTFAPDGRKVAFLQSDGTGNALALWIYDLERGERRQVVEGPSRALYTEAEELKRERERQSWEGVTSFAYAGTKERPVLLVPLAGRLHIQVGEGPLAPVPGTEGAVEGRMSEDGRLLAFVRDGAVFALDVPDGAPRRLTEGAAPGVTHGLAEYVAEEELDAHEGYWISPDGSHIAFKEVDTRHIPPFPIVHQGEEELSVEEHPYPFVGKDNARVRVGVVPAGGGPVAWLDLGAGWEYVARVRWTRDGRLAVLTLTRDQRRATWQVFAPGSWQGEELFAEASATWVNLSEDTRFLDGGDILTSDETTGFRHLVLRDREGRVKERLTAGEWSVTAVLDVDEEGRLVAFQGTGEGVLERHVYEVSLDGGRPRRLTAEPGWHMAVFSPDHRLFIDQVSTLEEAPRTLLKTRAGEVLATIHSDPSATAEALGLVPPEMHTLPAADGTPLMAALYRPREPGKGRTPAVVSVYGGPHVQAVGRRWDLTVDMRAQLLAQEGFLVLKLDNRGSQGRGTAFEGAIRHRFGTVEVEDQTAGARWLVEAAGADPGRIGIYGWSYGGYMTLMSLMKVPDVFRVGVAGAPVTDFRMYDTAYTERYMGLPEENPEGYREASVLTHAAGLRGRLLVIHGMIDENVHFRHTARLLSVLAEAGKEVSLLILPSSRHAPRGFAALRLILDRTVSFFRENL